MDSKNGFLVTCQSEDLPSIFPNLRGFLSDAYDGDFSDSDFQNALGGQHFLRLESDQLIAHAAVVNRSIAIDQKLKTIAYVEAVAVRKEARGLGIGFHLMQGVSDFCRANFELAMLSTDEPGFYRKLGWVSSAAQSFAQTEGGLVRTSQDDSSLMLLTDFEDLKDPRELVSLDRWPDPW